MLGWGEDALSEIQSSVFQCGTLNDDSPNENLTERVLQDAQRLFLMNDVVQPVTVDPYVTQDSIRFSKLVVDIVQGKDTLYHVMYIGTGKSMRASNSSSSLLVYLAALGAQL